MPSRIAALWMLSASYWNMKKKNCCPGVFNCCFLNLGNVRGLMRSPLVPLWSDPITAGCYHTLSQHAEAPLLKLDKDRGHRVYHVVWLLCMWACTRVSFSFCPVENDWFWSVECWQNVQLSQEVRDHRAETEQQPSLSSSPSFFSLQSPSSVLSHSSHLSPDQSNPFPSNYFYPPLWWVYW